MSKTGAKKGKLDVAEAGAGDALKHSPFAKLAAETAVESLPAAPLPQPPPEPAAEPAKPPKSRGRLVLRREKKGRGGKTVVVVSGLRADAHLPESEIERIAKQLRQQLGCGSSVERVPSDTIIVVQGDQPARVAELLTALGFRVDGVKS